MTKQMRRRNAVIVPNVPTKYGMSGVPDISVMHRLWHGYIETKVKNGKLTKHQADFQRMAAERNTPHCVLWFMNPADKTLNSPVKLVYMVSVELGELTRDTTIEYVLDQLAFLQVEASSIRASNADPAIHNAEPFWPHDQPVGPGPRTD